MYNLMIQETRIGHHDLDLTFYAGILTRHEKRRQRQPAVFVSVGSRIIYQSIFDIRYDVIFQTKKKTPRTRHPSIWSGLYIYWYRVSRITPRYISKLRSDFSTKESGHAILEFASDQVMHNSSNKLLYYRVDNYPLHLKHDCVASSKMIMRVT